MADIVLINPRFEVSYWGMEHALPLFGKRANMPVGLPAAAGRPDAGRAHASRSSTRTSSRSTSSAVARADIVGADGHERAAVPHAGDPRPSSSAAACSPWSAGRGSRVQEDYFDDLADVIFVGEAEETWPQFLREWQAGPASARATSRPRRPT